MFQLKIDGNDDDDDEEADGDIADANDCDDGSKEDIHQHMYLLYDHYFSSFAQ